MSNTKSSLSVEVNEESKYLLFPLWNTNISLLNQQVAVDNLVFCVGYMSAQILPVAVSAMLIGNWQTDFVIDHNARGDWCLYYSLGVCRFTKGHISLKLEKR